MSEQLLACTKTVPLSKMVSDNNLSENELLSRKSERLMEGIAYWTSFYRQNPQRFVKDFLNVTLKDFQQILLYEFMHNNYNMYLASRGQGKTYLVALLCLVKMILYPKTKIIIASGTKGQAMEVLTKIITDFMKNYGWGSENLRYEIEDWSTAINNPHINLKNGSWLKIITANDNARHERANIIVVDEFRMVPLEIVQTVLKKFLTAPRQPNYLNKPEYAHLIERNQEFYMSSAWYTSHWSYQLARSYYANMLKLNSGFFMCALPYQIAIKSHLLDREQVKDEMSEATFNEMSFAMEMGCMWQGDKAGAFFKYDEIIPNRKLKEVLYPATCGVSSKYKKVPELLPNERRIISLDIALMGSKKHNNDASSIILNSAIPTSSNKYIGNVVYMENIEDIRGDDLALKVRRYYDYFKCTDMVIDANGLGLPIYELIADDMFDKESGVFYPALNCRNNKLLAEKCKVPDAPKTIWAVKANAEFNSNIYNLLRSAFQQGKINLPISEQEAERYWEEKFKEFKSMEKFEKYEYLHSYLESTFLIYELIALQSEQKGTNTRVWERSGMRKDRVSSMAYNYWVQNELEKELAKNNRLSFNPNDYAKSLGKLNRKPIFY